MQVHIQLIQLIIAYALVGAFLFTLIITCGSLIGWVKFQSSSQQSKLFGVLIVQLCIAAVGFFGNLLKFNPEKVQQEILRDHMSAPGSFARASDFTASRFGMSKFVGGDFTSVQFDAADFKRSSFQHATFEESKFNGASFRGAQFEAPEGERWAHELKFDGYRMHARIDRGKVQLITARSGLDWTAKYSGLAEYTIER